MSKNTHDEIFAEGEVKGAVNASMRAAFKDFEEAAQSSDADKTVKLFGAFEVSAPVAALASGFFNEGTRHLGNKVVPHAYDISKSLLGKHLNLEGSSLNRGATVAAVTTNLVLGTTAYLPNLVHTVRAHRHNYKDMARRIAPLLEDISGNHSVGAFLSIREKDNEMIYAHRQRMATKMKVETSNGVIDLIVNGLPKIATTENVKHMWTGGASQAAAVVTKPDGMMEWLRGSVTMGSGPLATYITQSNNRKLAKQSRSFSALEMVLELDQQVAEDLKSHRSGSGRYTLPHAGHRSEEYSLEDYIVCIMRHHQTEMADISDKHTELRDALTEEASQAASIIAKAIRSGEISTLSLVRLIGEGQLIKRNGRAIASPTEVHELVKKFSAKQANYVHVDPGEYYKDAAFTREHLRTALKSLKGDELQTFASLFPNDVLEDAGMSTKEIKAIREATSKHFDQMIAEAVAGLTSKSDAELKTLGFAESELVELRKAASELENQGVEAVKQLKTSATHENGIEHLLTNAVVHKPEHLGMLVKLGREQLAEARAGEMADAAIERMKTGKHYAKNDDFSARELARRDEAQDVATERF